MYATRSETIDFRQSGHHLMRPRYVLGAFSLLLATTLMLTLAGPMFDHHVAERSPGHQHVYLGGIPVPHLHLSQVSHAHGHAEDALSTSPASPDHACHILVTPQLDATMALGGPSSIEASWVLASAQTIPRMRVHRHRSTSRLTSSFTPFPELPPPRPVL